MLSSDTYTKILRGCALFELGIYLGFRCDRLARAATTCQGRPRSGPEHRSFAGFVQASKSTLMACFSAISQAHSPYCCPNSRKREKTLRPRARLMTAIIGIASLMSIEVNATGSLSEDTRIRARAGGPAHSTRRESMAMRSLDTLRTRVRRAPPQLSVQRIPLLKLHSCEFLGSRIRRHEAIGNPHKPPRQHLEDVRFMKPSLSLQQG